MTKNASHKLIPLFVVENDKESQTHNLYFEINIGFKPFDNIYQTD